MNPRENKPNKNGGRNKEPLSVFFEVLRSTVKGLIQLVPEPEP